MCHFSQAIISVLTVVKQMPSDFEMEKTQVPPARLGLSILILDYYSYK